MTTRKGSKIYKFRYAAQKMAVLFIETNARMGQQRRNEQPDR